MGIDIKTLAIAKKHSSTGEKGEDSKSIEISEIIKTLKEDQDFVDSLKENDFENLINRPAINGEELTDETTLEDIGVSKVGRSNKYGDLDDTPQYLSNEFPLILKDNLAKKSVEYNGSKEISFEFPDLFLSNEAAGEPVGSICAYMGMIAPQNYLACDGTEYQISDYPHLAQHFEDNFGSASRFGGDGATTFAVPNLQGEFLRGAGVNAHINNGNGEVVGVHQDGTLSPGMQGVSTGNSFLYGYEDSSNYPTITNRDYTYYASKENSVNQVTVTGVKGRNSDVSFVTKYMSRPTNTSVLYCIKAKPTYYLNTNKQTNMKIKNFRILFDGLENTFALPVNGKDLNVYVNGLFMTENVDYTINSDVTPNTITLNQQFTENDICTATYISMEDD